MANGGWNPNAYGNPAKHCRLSTVKTRVQSPKQICVPGSSFTDGKNLPSPRGVPNSSNNATNSQPSTTVGDRTCNSVPLSLPHEVGQPLRLGDFNLRSGGPAVTSSAGWGFECLGPPSVAQAGDLERTNSVTQEPSQTTAEPECLSLGPPKTPIRTSSGTLPSTTSRASYKMPSAGRANGLEDVSNKLQMLRDASLQEISRKQVADTKRGRDKFDTTSLKDLDLARRPVDPRRPQASRRGWAEDSPVTKPNNGEQYASLTSPVQPASNVTQAPTIPSPQLPVEPPTKPTRQKWATKNEMDYEKEEEDSNAWGSAAPSEATRESNVSDKSFGKLLNKKPADMEEETLRDYAGGFLPPPADWSDRPRFNNNHPAYLARFKDCLLDAPRKLRKGQRWNNGVPYEIIPPGVLIDMEQHPDGLSMVTRDATIDTINAAYYGYTDDPKDAMKYAQPTHLSEFDDWAKLDPHDDYSAKRSQETAEILVKNWLEHIANARQASIDAGMHIENKPAPLEEKPKPFEEEDVDNIDLEERFVPKLNIYLRPATKADVSELTRIYNWYINNSACPPENAEIGESGMRERIEMCAESRFPFIVAAKKNQRGARELQVVDDEELSRRLNLPVTHKRHITLTRVEQLAGFCCANDLTVSDYVEHISAELELYVDPLCKRMGVGRCLMDRMLQICDRGHRLTTECAFHCDQSIRHSYGPGGNRDVHRLFILMRKWSHPKAGTLCVERRGRHRKLPMFKTTEDEYSRWVKQWLESFDFEQNGMMPQMGAKNGRYVDIAYLSRAGAWQPAEGHVPGPALQDTISAQDLQDDEDEDDNV